MNRLYSLVFFLLLFTQVQSQETTESDSIQRAEATSNLLMLSLGYTSNNIKTKNYEYDRIPALLFDVNYFSKHGLTTSVNYTKYVTAPKNTYENNLQLGYQKTVFSRLNLQAFYERRIFSGDTTYEGLAQNNTIGFNADYNWKMIDFQVSNSFLNGKSNNYFLDLDLSLSLDFDHLLFKNDFLLFTPTLSSTFGTDNWIYQNLGPFATQIVQHYLIRNQFKTNNFAYQGLNIFLPLVYTLGDLGILFNWYYSWPSAKLTKLSWKNQSGFSLTLFYTPKL